MEQVFKQNGSMSNVETANLVLTSIATSHIFPIFFTLFPSLWNQFLIYKNLHQCIKLSPAVPVPATG